MAAEYELPATNTELRLIELSQAATDIDVSRAKNVSEVGGIPTGHNLALEFVRKTRDGFIWLSRNNRGLGELRNALPRADFGELVLIARLLIQLQEYLHV